MYIYICIIGEYRQIKILALWLNMDQASIIRPSHGCLPLKDQCVSFPASECGKPNAISIRSIVYPSHFPKMCRIQSCLAVADSAIPLQFQWGKWWLNTLGGTLFSVKAIWVFYLAQHTCGSGVLVGVSWRLGVSVTDGAKFLCPMIDDWCETVLHLGFGPILQGFFEKYGLF